MAGPGLTNKEFVKAELADVKVRCTKVIEGSELIACVPQSVRVKITRTEFKQLTVVIQFSEDYPATPLLIEINSKSIDYKLLEGLSNVCEEEAKSLLNKQQVLPVLKLVRKFIDNNPLCVCRDEIAHLTKHLVSDGSRGTGVVEIKLKQKLSQINVKVAREGYHFRIKLTVPECYPTEQLQVESVEHNFPELFHRFLIGQSIEFARRAIQPPLKKNPKAAPFQPKPSLRTVCEFFITTASRYTVEPCALCGKRAFSIDPADTPKTPRDKLFVDRVYCGHIFHYDCMSVYMKTPPFQGGKPCPICKARIYHDKWSITPELAEQRWAHKQAKQRELEEVMDFLD